MEDIESDEDEETKMDVDDDEDDDTEQQTFNEFYLTADFDQNLTLLQKYKPSMAQY